MKILILGSAGQIGAHLSDYLVNKNYVNVQESTLSFLQNVFNLNEN